VKKEIKHIGVLGGGTSGYLSALCIQRLLPGIEVTVIESSSVPIIGVGESTTPKLLRMLHDVLGFDISEFYRDVKPTWKLGVRYWWGVDEPEFTNNALGFISPFLSNEIKGDINYNSLNSRLMEHDKSFIVKTGNPEKPYKSHAIPHSYAYHLDNESLSAYLKKKAIERGIRVKDRKVVDVSMSENGLISGLLCESGDLMSFDFYVDCSGFRSLLLEKAMKAQYIPYNESLFTDTAIAGNVSHSGIIKPYTEARTMNNGWQWNIPMRNDDHLGYLYASNYCSDEEAEQEFRALNPGLGELRKIKFRSGRHKQFTVGNVAAVGNSYGFIEALQSTALHMVITNVYALVLHLMDLRAGRNRSELIGDNLGEIWDRLRWFIAMQFKYNSRKKSEFWTACREDADVSGIEGWIKTFETKGPLHWVKNEQESIGETEQYQIYGLFSHDFMLKVLGFLPAKMPRAIKNADHTLWKGKFAIWDQLAQNAYYQHEVLHLVESHPEILEFDKFFAEPFILDREFDLFDEMNIVDFIVRS